MSAANSRGQKWLRRSGLITGILGAGGLILFIWSLSDTVFWDSHPLALLDIIACGLLVLGSLYLAWNRPRIGGLTLIASNLLVTTVNAILDFTLGGKWAGMATIFWGAPSGVVLLISGILFLILGKKQQ